VRKGEKGTLRIFVTMATNIRNVVKLYQNLKQEWNKKPPNLPKCGECLSELKLALTELTFLPSNDENATKQELLIARDILETGALYSVASEDIPGFERYLAQLKSYYLDYKIDLPESPYKYQLLGLNLLSLLSQNRLAEFHTELELLPVNEIQSNIYLKHPVSMEQYLMEGSYNKVFLAKGNVPAESYIFFVDILLKTIRSEIASCIESSYDRLAVSAAMRKLFFDSERAMKNYAAERNWVLEGAAPHGPAFVFGKEERKDETIPSSELVARAVGYARELEMIV